MARPLSIRRLFDRKPRTVRKAPARVRPAIENLEDRLAPANLTLTTLADNTTDTGNLTLRDAISLVNSGGNPAALGQASMPAAWAAHITGTFGSNDTISIPSSLYASGFNFVTGEPQSTIPLNGTQLPTITGQLTIVGDQTPFVVNGISGGVPDWYVSGEGHSRVFQVGPTGNLTLENLTINHGSTAGNGGGILNQGSLTLENVTLTADAAASGGGIASTGAGSLTIDHSTITNNRASISGGGVYTSSATATFAHDKINNNTVTGADYSTNSPSSSPFNGGSVEGGGIVINGGVVSVSFTTLDGNALQGGQGAPGSGGTSYDPSHRPVGFLQGSAPGAAGGDGARGGAGGSAFGGGIVIDGGSLDISTSTLSNNIARGGVAGAGGTGGTGQGGQDGTNAVSVVSATPGGAGGPGGRGGDGGPGGEAGGSGLYVGLFATGVTMTSTTVADDQAIGGQGGRSGAGGRGGDGGSGGNANPTDGGAAAAGGTGGAGGNGGTTGVPGVADGGGIYFDPSSYGRQIANSTIAFNTVSRGQDAQPIVVNPFLTIPANGPGGPGGAGGENGITVTVGTPPPPTFAANGQPGQAGAFAAAPQVFGGGLYENDRIFGVGLFQLKLVNSIVAANTENTSTASDIVGTLATLNDVGNLIGTGGAGGLVNGQGENQVGVSSPGLLPLGNYGGETQTILLDANSPAINAGQNAFTSVTTDQRGFPRIGNGTVDVGAVEVTPTFVVTTLQDNEIDDAGAGASLRGAIEAANKSTTPRTITFAPGLTGTIALTLGELQITNSMTIDGPGANLLSISGNHASRVFEIDNPPSSLSNVTISGLTVTDGNSGPNGFFFNRLGIPAFTGGGIYNQAQLTLESVAVSNNVVPFTTNGTLQCGGGIYSTGPLTLITSTVSNNSADRGAGICSDNESSLTITGSTVSSNHAGNGGFGGGILIQDRGSANILDSAITLNTSLNGGGIYNSSGSSLTVTNSTMAGNSTSSGAPLSGNAIATDGATDVFTSVTFAANDSSDVRGSDAARFTFANCILTDGIILSPSDTVSLHGTNLMYAPQGLSTFGLPSNVPTAGVITGDPVLGPLQDNGGPTPTMALLPGSPAVDAGDNSYAVDASGNPLQTDQNGFKRISGAGVDLGAYEMQPATLNPLMSVNGQEGIPYSQRVTATQAGYQPSWGTFTFTGGALPPGLSLSADGVLSGTPTAAGTFTFTVTASDLAGFGSRPYTLAVSPPPAPVVDTLADNFDYDYSAGHLSLREALYVAQLPGVTTPVTFAPGLTGTIALTGGQLAITSGVTIRGPGADVLTIDAGGHSRVFSVTGGTGDAVSVSGLTISGGSAATGGGIWNADTLTLRDVVVTDNRGGGIENQQGNLYLLDSTVSNNTTANTGGGIDMPAGGALTAVNTTIADNAAADGGGIFSNGVAALFGGQNVPATVSLTNVTVADNSAGQGAGVFNGQESTLTLANTIIGEDTGPEVSNGVGPGGVGIGSFIVVQGQNLVQGGLAGFPAVLSADPLLGPLQNNGGPTPTLALLPGSPAIDAGVNGSAVDASGSSLTTDQRGLPRIRGAAADLGAFEVYGPAVVDTLADTSNGDYSPGHFSLREAVLIGASPITFAPGLHGTITLSQGPLVITGGLAIQGPGANVLTIDGGGHSSVFHIAGAHAAYPPPITTSISGLTITNASDGIDNTSDTLSLNDVVVTGNSTAGIDNNQAVLHVVNSTISSNQGSGIVDVDGQVTLVGSTVANNIGGDQNGNGGGISVVGTGGIMEATLTAVNTTIADNAAPLEGGGIYASGTADFLVVPVRVTLTNVTVAGNNASYGAGIFNSTGSTLTICNTILGANNGSDLTNDVTDEFLGANGFTMALGANLVQSVDALNGPFSQAAGGEFQANPAVISADPKLGPLQNNGGPTPTMALLPGSPAIDAGDNGSIAVDPTTGMPYTVDQRGFRRVVGGHVDLGACERQVATITVTPYNLPYDGNAHTATGTATGIGGLDLSPDLILTGTTHTKAGTSTDTWSFHDPSGIYADQSGTVSDSISPATPTLSVSDAGGTYNGNAFSAADSVAGVVTGVDTTPASALEGVAPTLTYYPGTYATLAALDTALAGGLTGSGAAPTAAGSYTVLASFAGSADYGSGRALATFSIGRATPSVSVSDAGGTYNQKPFAATASVAGINGLAGTSLEGVSPTLTYYSGSTASGTPLAGAPTLPGTYTAQASFAGSADYAPAGATTTFTIQTPTASITGPSIGVPGQPLTYAFAVNGPTQGVAFTINFGDGTTLTTAPGGPSLKLDHLYHAIGTYTIQVTAKDPSGVVSQPAIWAVAISRVALEANPGGGTDLAVGGNAAGGDTVLVTGANTAGTAVSVTFDKAALGTFTPTGHILVYGQGGKDTVTLRPYAVGNTNYYIQVPALLYGEGSGGDHLSAKGSAAANVLTGHGANEVLTGGRGRDLLIAGTGAATLNAGTGDDILIGGWTDYDLTSAGRTYDQKLSALDAVMAEWGSATDPYATRLSKLAGYLSTSTVHDNSANGQPVSDQLLGKVAANDWFFAGLSDVVRGKNQNDRVTAIS